MTITNVFLTYPFYVIPVFYPDLIWLGLIQVGQGMFQITNHAIYTNLKMKTFYNPGVASCVLLQWPLGIYYIWYVQTHHLATTADYVIGFVGTVASIFVLWLGPIALLRSKQSKYPFTEAQMFGFKGDWVRSKLRS